MLNGKRPGQTLIEVVMATMIAAMTTTAVFSVILSSFVSGGKADKRDAAAMVLRRAQQTLNSYVTVAPFDGSYSAGSPAGQWQADTSSNNRWALRNGQHNLSSMLQGTPLYDPDEGKAHLYYTVSSNDCGFGMGSAPYYELACKTVSFELTYPD